MLAGDDGGVRRLLGAGDSIGGASTRPEVVLREALAELGVVAAPQRRVSGVRVDLAIGERVVVLVDGCFWHGCPRHYVRPRANAAFWARKLRENVERDARQTQDLITAGRTVMRLWEHTIFEALSGVVASLKSTGVASDVSSLRDVQIDADEGSGIELRRLVNLADPSTIVETVSGPRMTAKWRHPRSVSRSPSASAPGSG
jgi:DNA mismatch endonuclease, patch repair protein